MINTSALRSVCCGCALACGSETFRWPCCTKVVVSTKNISNVSSTSINETTLISNSSSRRRAILILELSPRGCVHAGTRRGFRRGRCRRGLRLLRRNHGRRHRFHVQGRKLVQQRGRLFLHRHHVTG